MVTYFPKPLNKQVADISGSVSQTQDGIAIVANGNTHAAISSGQFVYVKNHDTLAEGLYKSTTAIAQNGTLSTSNLTADGSGGLNDLQSQITSLNSKITPSGWQSISTDYGTIYYRSNGIMCELYYNNDNHTRTETGSLMIATLPVGARPSRNFNLLHIKGSNGIYIYSDGGFYITNLSDSYVGFHTMYFV